MTRRDFYLKWTVYGIALLLVTVVNYYVLNHLPLGAPPLLIPLAVAAAGILEGARAGAGFGIAAGLVLSAAVHGSPLWVCGLSLLGWVCGLLAQYVLRRDFVGFFLMALAAGALRVLWLLLSGVAGGVAPLSVLLPVAAAEQLWTLVFAGPVYGLFRFCCVHYGRIYHG